MNAVGTEWVTPGLLKMCFTKLPLGGDFCV